jgi:hypothetical protein
MDYKRNEEVLKGLTEPVLDKISKYKNNWVQHVDKLQRDRLHELLNITDDSD